MLSTRISITNCNTLYFDLTYFKSSPFNHLKKPLSDKSIYSEIDSFISNTESDSDSRFVQSLSRSKRNLKYLALNNPWDYFGTITIDAQIMNRYDKSFFSKKLRKFLNNLKNRYCPDLKYLIVFEPHADGAVHCHCLFNKAIECIFSGQYTDLSDWRLNPNLRKTIEQGHPVYYSDIFSKNFGPIHSFIKAYGDGSGSYKYISKYLTKSDFNSVFYKSGEKLFMHSTGLLSAYNPIYSYGEKLPADILGKPIFENDYLQKADLDFMQLKYLVSSGFIDDPFLKFICSLENEQAAIEYIKNHSSR